MTEDTVTMPKHVFEAMFEALGTAQSFMGDNGLMYSFDDEYTRVHDAYSAAWDIHYGDRPQEPRDALREALVWIKRLRDGNHDPRDPRSYEGCWWPDPNDYDGPGMVPQVEYMEHLNALIAKWEAQL